MHFSCSSVMVFLTIQKDESFYTVCWACNIDGTPFLLAGGSNGIIRVINSGTEKIHKVTHDLSHVKWLMQNHRVIYPTMRRCILHIAELCWPRGLDK